MTNEYKQMLTNLIGRVLLENDVDGPPELTLECTHGDTVRFALPQFFGEEGIKIGIPVLHSDSCILKGFPQIGRVSLGNMALRTLELSGGKYGGVNSSIIQLTPRSMGISISNIYKEVLYSAS